MGGGSTWEQQRPYQGGGFPPQPHGWYCSIYCVPYQILTTLSESWLMFAIIGCTQQTASGGTWEGGDHDGKNNMDNYITQLSWSIMQTHPPDPTHEMQYDGGGSWIPARNIRAPDRFGWTPRPTSPAWQPRCHGRCTIYVSNEFIYVWPMHETSIYVWPRYQTFVRDILLSFRLKFNF
jgi:hypothetical protein